MNARYKFPSIFLLSIVFLVNASASIAQTNLPNLLDGETDSSFVKKVTPIPVNEIPARIEEAESDIKFGEKKILPKKSVTEIDSLLPIFIEFLNVQKVKAEKFIKANPNRSKIDNLINKWDGYYGQLDTWQNTINDISDKNMDLITPYKEKEYLWTISLELAKKEDAPSSIISSINRTLRDFENIKQAIIDENNNLLTLETRIINYKSLVNETIEEFDYLKNSEVYNVFYHRHKALWNTSLKEIQDNPAKSDSMDSIPNRLSNILVYLKENPKQVYSFLFIVALIAFSLLYFKRVFSKIKFTEQNAHLQRAKEIVSTHTIPAIVFTIGIIALLFLKNIPFLLWDVLVLTTLIASIPMLKGSIYNRFERILYYVLLFYLINSLKTYIWFSTPIYRIYLLVEALLMLAVVFRISHPYLKTRKINTSAFGTLVIKSIPAFYFIIVVSIISNLLGYTNLTDLCLKVVSLSSALTIVFYGLLMVSNGLVIGGLHLLFTSQEHYDVDRKLFVEKRATAFIRIVIFAWWLYYFLGVLDLRDPVGVWLRDFLTESYKFGSVSFSLQEIISFIVVLTISFLASNFISMVVDGGALSFLKLPKGIPAAISLVLRYFIIAFGFVLAISGLGIDLKSFNLMAGALGLGIGFGLQTIISNFVSGIILVFERPILQGDIVEVQKLKGKVTNIGVRSSRVRTFDGAEVVVPNNNLISNDLINWTLSDSVKRIEIVIGAAYGSDPNLILKILLEEALKNEFTITDPEPIAFFNEFGDSSLNFRLLVWAPFDKGLISKSNISVGIYNSFKKHGIEIPFPQRDVHVKDIAEKKNEPKKQNKVTKQSKDTESDESDKNK